MKFVGTLNFEKLCRSYRELLLTMSMEWPCDKKDPGKRGAEIMMGEIISSMLGKPLSYFYTDKIMGYLSNEELTDDEALLKVANALREAALDQEKCQQILDKLNKI